MPRLRIVALCLAFAALLKAQGPPPGTGETIQSLALGLAALTTRVTQLEGRVTAVEGRATALEASATNLGARAASLEGRAGTLEGRATSLEARASKLESGQIVAADLVGTYALYGFQNELGPSYVSSYVFITTLVLQANGTFSGTGTETGHTLAFPPFLPGVTTRTVINFPDPPRPTEVFNGNWSYSGGMLHLGTGFGSWVVGAGGRVFIGAGANHADNTNVILIGTRLP